MEHTRFFTFVFLGVVLLVLETECQELVTLNVPSMAPFVFHPTEELSMDISEMHPVFLYSSSQNDYIHQNLPEHVPVKNHPRPPHSQANSPRNKFPDSRPPIAHNQRNNNRNNPQLTYGFQPKASSNRQNNLHQSNRQDNFHRSNRQDNLHPSNRPDNYHQSNRQDNLHQSNRQDNLHQSNRPDNLHQSNRQDNIYNRQKKFHSNQQKSSHNHRSRQPQEPVFQPASRLANQHQSSHFSENIQIQASVQHHRQNNGLSINTPTEHTNFQSTVHHRPQQFVHPENKYNPQSSEHRRPSRNNINNRNNQFREENRTPGNTHRDHRNIYNQQEKKTPANIHHNHRNYQSRDEHRQESVRKHITFDDTVQDFRNRNAHNNGNDFPQKASNSFHGQSLPQRNRNNNERLNLQPYARSMREENKVQLPPRPPFNNGAVKINTIAGELPILHFDSIDAINDAINENPTLQNGNHHSHASADDQDKKTYLLIKAPESPTSAPFILENLKHTSIPYIINNLPETTVHIPEIFSTSPEPHSLPQNVEAPAIVLDLVQIPDHAVFNHEEKHFVESLPRSEFRSTETKEHDQVENFRPTESYPTTPLHPFHDVNFGNNVYSPVAENSIKHQNKLIPKPKIRESKKFLNTSFQPISYSSSVSVVSVKQNADSKQQAPKKQKTTLKKAFPHKKKAKVPENEDFSNDGSQDIPGQAGEDYPIYKDIPKTSFECGSMESPGFYADLDTGCQVFHNCDTTMVKHSFMCPNGTIFHQELFICDWWYNVKCDDTPEFYSLNSGLYITDNSSGDSKKKA